MLRDFDQMLSMAGTFGRGAPADLSRRGPPLGPDVGGAEDGPDVEAEAGGEPEEGLEAGELLALLHPTQVAAAAQAERSGLEGEAGPMAGPAQPQAERTGGDARAPAVRRRWRRCVDTWRRLARRTLNEVGDDGCTHMAAAIAYYALVSIFPCSSCW
jgi:hypothetical protein